MRLTISLAKIAAIVLFAAPSFATAQVCDECLRKALPTCTVNEDNRFVVSGCKASVTAAWDGTSAPTQTNQCTATVPPAWMLLDVLDTIVSENNGSYSISRYSAGTDLEYKNIIDVAYQTALEIAGKIADQKDRAEAEGKISQEYKQRVELYEKLKTNVDTVKVTVSATPHGSFLDRKRGWMEVGVNLRVMCVAPLDLLDQIKARYGLNSVPSKLLNSIYMSNKAGNDKFIAWRVADRFTPCEKSATAISLMRAPANQVTELAIDPQLVMCYSEMNSFQGTPRFDSTCTARFGATVDLRSVPQACKGT